MKSLARAAVITTVLLLSACGNKGPLVHSASPAGDEWRETEARRERANVNRERAEQGLPPLQAQGQQPQAGSDGAAGEAEQPAPPPASDEAPVQEGDPAATHANGEQPRPAPAATPATTSPSADPDPGNG